MNWTNKLSFRWIIILMPVIGFILVVLSFSVLSYLGNKSLSLLEQLQKTELLKLQSLNDINNDLSKIHMAIYDHIHTSNNIANNGDYYNIEKYLSLEIISIEDRLKKHSDQYLSDSEMTKKLKTLLKTLDTYRNKTTDSMKMATVDLIKSQELFLDSSKHYIEIKNKFINNNQYIHSRLNHQSMLNHQNTKKQFTYVLILSLLLTGFLIIISSIISKSYAVNFHKKIDVLKSLFTHNAQNTVKYNSSNELEIMSSVIENVKFNFDTLENTSQTLGKQEARLRTTLNSIMDGAITINETGKILTFNRAAETLFGYTKDEIIGTNINQLMPEPFASEHSNYLKRYLETGKAKVIGKNIEVTGLRKNKDCFPMHLLINELPPQEDGNRCFIGSLRDITQSKEAEEIQQNYLVKLEQGIKERTSELEKKATDLERATRLKSEFLANMSHDLRTPMNSIIGFTNRLIKKAADKLEEKQLNNLRTVERNARHLLDMINGLLDLSKIEAGKMESHAEEFDFKKLVNELSTLSQTMLEGKSIELVVDLPVEEVLLNTDIVKLKQILINLLSNAIKFTSDGKITLSANLLNNKNEPEIVIQIIDTGIGISKNDLAYIFDTFRQVDGATSRKVSGTGLGLAIVSRFVKLLRGTISVDSEEDVGTRFEILIPVNLNGTKIATQIPRIPQIEAIQYSSEKQTILCIDDDKDVLDLISGYLIDEGFQVVTTTDSEEALSQAKLIQPLAITLDIMMPKKDGWSVLSELKSCEQTHDIPVFIISFLNNKALGYQLGAFDVMQKPVDPEILIDSLNHLSHGRIKTALIIDDDHEIRDLMHQVLDDANITSKHAAHGEEALAILQQSKQHLPELILLDLMMPGINGFKLLEKIQQNSEWATIPVIVISAKNLEKDEMEFLQPRVAGILDKHGLSSVQVLKQLEVAVEQFKEKSVSGKTL